jgi:hypothetical protein
MWRFAFVALLVVACQNPQKEPEGYAEIDKHVDYDKFRPVTIAILPVQAPNYQLRTEVRKEVYRLLPAKRYSPFKLETVDAHISSDGKWDPGSLDWDATLSVAIDRWKPVRGSNYFAADGTAQLTHKTGEVLWTCRFYRHNFEVEMNDHEEAAQDIAKFLVGSEPGKERFPDCPPLPRE